MRNFILILIVLMVGTAPAIWAQSPKKPMAAKAQVTPLDISQRLIKPEELVLLLKSQRKPLLLQIGSHVMFQQAHIPDSEYIGAGSDESGLQKLKSRVKALPRNKAIVLYCGCCPWEHCPNVKPAFAALQAMGFRNVKVLYIPNNFGTDWVQKGYPVARGE